MHAAILLTALSVRLSLARGHSRRSIHVRSTPGYRGQAGLVERAVNPLPTTPSASDSAAPTRPGPASAPEGLAAAARRSCGPNLALNAHQDARVQRPYGPPRSPERAPRVLTRISSSLWPSVQPLQARSLQWLPCRYGPVNA
jgi:hypothetical protein